jgi:hypothetical protein
VKSLAALPTVLLVSTASCGGGIGGEVIVSGVGGCGECSVSGIDGLVVAGPTCPVIQTDLPCPKRPIGAPIQIIRMSDGSATDLQSDDQGKFRVTEEPGQYEVRPLSIPGQALPAPGPSQEVTVERNNVVGTGRFASVTVTYDTGIQLIAVNHGPLAGD